MQAQAIQSIRRTIVDHRFQVMSVAVLGWSLNYTVRLAVVHNTGPELYGVLTAAVSAGSAIANLAILRARHATLIATAAVVSLWVIVALAGVGGTIAHIVGPVAGHGPVDLRPRPIVAPFVFTLLGAVGATALVLGQRARARRASQPEKE